MAARDAFDATGAAYDAFMGRYSVPLAALLADAAGLSVGQRAGDVGSGPGALTAELARRLGPGHVVACDPSAAFAAECGRRNPGVEVTVARAEQLPWPDAGLDAVFAQLVLHFVADPDRAMTEAARVLAPGGTFVGCVWDFAEGMQMLRAFWDAALAVDPAAPDEATTMRFGRAGELRALLDTAGFEEVEEATARVASDYTSFDQLWAGFLEGVGPAGSYTVSLDDHRRDRLRRELFERLDRPTGPITLTAVARTVRGRVR